MWDDLAPFWESEQNANIRESGCVKASEQNTNIMESGCHTNIKESERVDNFYIRPQVDRQPSLWPDDVVKAITPPSLPHAPLLNYNVMAMGWEWQKGAYDVNSVWGGIDKKYIPWDHLASACI